jgi:uncharacterized protein (TIGR03000 family)
MTQRSGKIFIAALIGLLFSETLQARSPESVRTQLRILVPDEAFVFVARERMKATGTERLFESPPLRPGRRYTYEISVIHEGQEIVRLVRFEAGSQVEVDFREACEKLSTPATLPPRPFKPIRPEWLPRRVYRA